MPIYTSKPTTFEEVVRPLPNDIQSITRQLRQLIQRVIPNAHEQITGGKKIANVLYSVGESTKVVCGIQPTKEFCRLFLHGWREVEKHGYKLSGSGKHARHIKFYKLIEIDPKSVAQMIELAKETVLNRHS